MLIGLLRFASLAQAQCWERGRPARNEREARKQFKEPMAIHYWSIGSTACWERGRPARKATLDTTFIH
jgi:hypothetical protein